MITSILMLASLVLSLAFGFGAVRVRLALNSGDRALARRLTPWSLIAGAGGITLLFVAIETMQRNL